MCKAMPTFGAVKWFIFSQKQTEMDSDIDGIVQGVTRFLD